jgi:hypothetical protein
VGDSGSSKGCEVVEIVAKRVADGETLTFVSLDVRLSQRGRSIERSRVGVDALSSPAEPFSRTDVSAGLLLPPDEERMDILSDMRSVEGNLLNHDDVREGNSVELWDDAGTSGFAVPSGFAKGASRASVDRWFDPDPGAPLSDEYAARLASAAALGPRSSGSSTVASTPVMLDVLDAGTERSIMVAGRAGATNGDPITALLKNRSPRDICLKCVEYVECANDLRTAGSAGKDALGADGGVDIVAGPGPVCLYSVMYSRGGRGGRGGAGGDSAGDVDARSSLASEAPRREGICWLLLSERGRRGLVGEYDERGTGSMLRMLRIDGVRFWFCTLPAEPAVYSGLGGTGETGEYSDVGRIAGDDDGNGVCVSVSGSAWP